VITVAVDLSFFAQPGDVVWIGEGPTAYVVIAVERCTLTLRPAGWLERIRARLRVQRVLIAAWLGGWRG
jgi:hypothetical protein